MAEDGQAPVKVTADQLGISQGEEHEGQLEFDLGNLMAFDPSPVDASTFAGDASAACQRLATGILQALTSRLFALPSEPAAVGRAAELPPPSTVLPREKPLPKPRPPTKWELFAQRKGIVKHKRSLLEFDESAQEWRRRYGYKKAGDEADVPVIEARPDDQVGEDPFTKQRHDKKDRVKKQAKRELANLKAAAKGSGAGALPPTLRLAAVLPEHGKGRPAKRKELHGELKATTRQVGVSTASMGKFDRLVGGEKAQDRKLPGAAKRRKFTPVADKAGSEREAQNKLVDHILRSNADDVVDIGRAIGKLEAAAREERHQLKMKGANKKGRLSRGGGGGGGRGGAESGRAGAKGGKGSKGGGGSGGMRGVKAGGSGRGGKRGGKGKR